MFKGSFLIANCCYNYMFAADTDKKGSDHLVETRPSSCAKPNGSDAKFLWEISDAGNGSYHIRNGQYGYIFAADKDKSDNDHLVEARPDATSSDLSQDKFKWRISKAGNYYAIENVKYGATFAADSDSKDGDHIVEASPEDSASDKGQVKFKWMFFDEYALCNWMKQLNGSNSLASFSIPGTHDSGARYGGSAVEAQTRTLADQMNAGVRFLDIRCRHSENHFSIFHGVVYQNMNFQDVLDQCYSFLSTNPTEMLIMSVKDEGGGDQPVGTFQQQFETYIASTRSQWFLDNRIPSLDEVRGKIVLLRRFPADTLPLGLAGNPGWKDNDTFVINTPPIVLDVQDLYNTTDADKKWDAVKGMLDRSKSSEPSCLFINFASAVGGGVIPNPKEMADQINPKLVDYFVANRGRFGVIPMDFNLANISGVIVNSNF